LTGVSPKAKLIVGVIASPGAFLEQAEAAVAAEFGPVNRRSPTIPFDYTDYYEPEMGKGLVRQWFATEGLVPADKLADLKLKAGQLENRFREQGKRRVNLDPGLLSLHNLTLATTKGFAHRVYLRDGIHAEVTLLYKSGAFHALEWTYPDYRSQTCFSFLADCRRDLIADLAADS
jgi:hypothetical protein